jgi:serine/threonine protein kinase
MGVAEALTHAARIHGVLVRGSTFGVYVVGQCIGEGGMARVYQAEHAGLRRQVALKVLSNGFAQDPEGRERFVREARMAAAIKHPNVVNIFDVGVHQDIPFLVMELLEGTDLETLIQDNGGPLSESLILDIMVPVVAGLIAVHDAGIVHRDLKPGNIFLAKGRYEELEPKLLDFGVSRVAGPEQLRLTTRGLVGTPFYMSPEGLRGEEMTPLSDQYSLGVLMYECATARAPFSASTLPDLMRAIGEGRYLPPNTHNPNLSKRLVRIITRAMSLDPAQRFADLRELGRELLLLAGQRTRITWGLSFGEGVSPPPHPANGSIAPLGGTLPPAPLTPRWKKATPWVLLAAALLAVLLVMQFSGSPSPTFSVARSAAASPPPLDAANGPSSVTTTPVPVVTRDDSTPTPVDPGPDSAKRSHFPADKAEKSGKLRSRRPAPVGVGHVRNNSDDTPDWAMPSSEPSPAAQAKSSQAPGAALLSGTNGAPIFD